MEIEHWVIVWKNDEFYDFVRCHPSRSGHEREAFEKDGFTVEVEVVEIPENVSAATMASKRIKELRNG